MSDSVLSFSLLAIETATEACSAALYQKGKLLCRYQLAPKQHAALILEMCNQLLAEAALSPTQLSAIAFGCGPGSFTGVKIAAAVAQGIAVAHDIPVIAVSSLQAIAQRAFLELGVDKVIAGIDARRDEIYTGKYILHHNIMQLRDKEKEIVISPEKLDVSDISSAWFYAGSAFQKADIIFPSASAVISIALNHWQQKNMFSPEQALPVYLRDNVVF